MFIADLSHIRAPTHRTVLQTTWWMQAPWMNTNLLKPATFVYTQKKIDTLQPRY